MLWVVFAVVLVLCLWFIQNKYVILASFMILTMVTFANFPVLLHISHHRTVTHWEDIEECSLSRRIFYAISVSINLIQYPFTLFIGFWMTNEDLDAWTKGAVTLTYAYYGFRIQGMLNDAIMRYARHYGDTRCGCVAKRRKRRTSKLKIRLRTPPANESHDSFSAVASHPLFQKTVTLDDDAGSLGGGPVPVMLTLPPNIGTTSRSPSPARCTCGHSHDGLSNLPP